MDFTILKLAGVGQQEFGNLVGVSRVSVNNWVRGKANPSRHVEEKCKRYLAYLKVAHRMKLLPGQIPTMHKTNVASRKEYIRDRLEIAAQKITELKHSKK
jgi:hypothetical protein